ncbi:MAG TPA: hypothetical protein PKA39_08155 [Ignavibacteria bacterium]|jgi:hypothetical protein|nr:hypothetical protein [Ignavibacteria bacterium]
MKNTLFVTLGFLTLLIPGCSGQEKVLNVGDKLQHDDFFYSVQKVMKTGDFVGKKTDGIFYVVMFKVQNDAKRTEHDWNRNVLFVVDENGKEYENKADLQKEYSRINYEEYKESYKTAAGTSDSTVVVFELPKSVKQPYIKYRGDFLMGDLFSGNAFKNSKVKLF